MLGGWEHVMQDATAANFQRIVVAATARGCVPLTRRTAILATCSALAFPEVARATETVKVGQMAPLTGPAAEAGLRQVNGAKQAAEAVNAAGGVLGRPIELFVQDDQSTNPGGVLAFSRLAARGDLVGFLASQRSTLLHAIAPDVQKVAKPTIMAGTDPMLTRLGYRWMFRVRPSDRYSARVIADFGTTTLKKQKWAIIHSTDAFGTSAVRALADTRRLNC
jgi:branched-chain amino acid transport system substrate-binding protein